MFTSYLLFLNLVFHQKLSKTPLGMATIQVMLEYVSICPGTRSSRIFSFLISYAWGSPDIFWTNHPYLPQMSLFVFCSINLTGYSSGNSSNAVILEQGYKKNNCYYYLLRLLGFGFSEFHTENLHASKGRP